MKKILIASLALLVHIVSFAQVDPIQQKAIILKRMIEMKHVSPRPVDDSFSVSVFRSMLNTADPRRLIFTDGDYQQLLTYKLSIDDEVQGKNWAFYNKFSNLFKKALTRADSIVNRSLQKPFDYNAAETITQSRRSKSSDIIFAANEAALISKWNRYLKFSILDNVFEAVEADSSNKNSFKNGLIRLEPSIREKLRKAEDKSIKRSLNYAAGFNSLVTEMYLNCIAESFDPHTSYFSPKAKEEFQAELSTESYYFGIVFDINEKGNVFVDKLTPGGAAWKSGEINQGDELVSLQWEGKEVQDMTGAELKDVYELLDQSIHNKLLFRFKKADGTMSMVFLKKEKTENDENIVKSFILNGDKKIGYILLPGFYTEWENESGSSCANDVAREIVKLKKENIEGLILDLRYNGGGSVGEALEMIGIFVDEGPLAATKEKSGKVLTLKDPNRGTIYDGPLALMINGQSASASEMLAAALQDYNRAVLTGSPSYGKATMQSMFPMDTITSKTAMGNENTDMVKITIGKLYRVTGQSAQFSGVKPDVLLPDAFEALEIGEKFQPMALTPDTVKRNNYYKPLPGLPLTELSRRSSARVIVNPEFQLISKIIDQSRKEANSRTVPLKADLFEKWMQQQEQDASILKGEGQPALIFKVDNHSQDKLWFAANDYARERNKEWLDNLGEDIYIQEVYQVVADLINLQKATPKN